MATPMRTAGDSAAWRAERAEWRPLQVRALTMIGAALDPVHEDVNRLFYAIWHDEALGRRSVAQLARALAVGQSTLGSRLSRAGLPGVKRLLLWAELTRVTYEMEANHARFISDVVYSLGWSSPQDFARAVGREWMVGAASLRDRGAEWALTRYRTFLIEPYIAQWRTVRPLVVGAHLEGAAS